MGHESTFVEGLRVTDDTTMEIAEMVLGRVNKHIIQMLDEVGVKSRRTGWQGWTDANL